MRAARESLPDTPARLKNKPKPAAASSHLTARPFVSKISAKNVSSVRFRKIGL
jgi:hypothetical protein